MLFPSVKSLMSAAAAVAAALVVAGGAGAADVVVRPDDRATHGPGAVAQEKDRMQVTSGDVARPDDRAAHGPGAIAAARREVVLRPDDRADRRLPGSTAPVAQPASGEGFDWVDAGVGSAATLGLIVLVAGISVLRLRHGAQTA
jgi:hypothetical protein